MRQKASVLFMVLACPCLFAAARHGTSSALPDAPAPQAGSMAADASTLPPARFYWRTIPPGYRAQRLGALGKLKLVAHEIIDPLGLVPATVSAGTGVWIDSNPKYGTNADAFGQRFGAALVRQTSFRLFSDGLLPAAVREDPRYYRLGKQRPWKRRLGYAITRVFVGRTDAGADTPNYSAVLGRAFGAALTPAYYPPDSRTSKVVFQTFGTAIVGEMGLDLLREFTPGAKF